MDIIDKIDMVLDEGTWALAKTDREKKKLKSLMSKPLKAKDADHKLYNLIGDDELFDELENLKREDPNTDVRPTVQAYIKKFKIKL